jgi:hypothetical protein
VSGQGKPAPTILRVMEHCISLQFDRELIERLHRQRPPMDQHQSPDVFNLFGLFEQLVDEVWEGDKRVGFRPGPGE